MNTLNVNQEVIDQIYKQYFLEYDWTEHQSSEPLPNEYFLWKSLTSKSSAVVKYIGKDQFKVVNPKNSCEGIKPQDLQQTCLMDALLDSDIKLLTSTGIAGAGKTLISLAYGIQEITHHKEMKLILLKPTETVKQSKFMAAVPGTSAEKYMPFLDSFYINLRKVLPDSSYIDLLVRNEKIIFKPIEFIRGDTYDDSVIILDESQNVSFHEVKTLISRVGENSKIILLGDTTQKDIRQNELSGLELLYNSYTFKESYLTAHIELVNSYRSELCKFIQSVDDEIGRKRL